jgi:hypothetical protein
MNLLRPAYDAAWQQLMLTPLAITVAQRDAFWDLLVPSNAQTAAGRRRLTATAHALLEPLRREINTVKHQRADGRFTKKVAKEPGKPEVDLDALHSNYLTRLVALREHIDATLRTNGHYCLPGDEAWAQPIQVIVANERQAGRPAGMSNWTQWEDPATVRKLTRIFAAGPKAERGAQWSPYLPDGTRRRGAAAEQKATAVWRGAFHDAIANQLHALAPNPDAWPLIKFFQSLKDSRTQQHIEDAVQAQVAAHKTPANPAFKDNIWLALDQGTRAALASEFHAALLECQEKLLAQRRPNDAPQFDPAVVPNPWALTEEEQEFKTEPAAAGFTIVPASTFDTVSNSTPAPEPDNAATNALADMLDAWPDAQH